MVQVQVVGLLCRTPGKESRHELLRRVAAGGGVFENNSGTKIHLPAANLNEIACQADDILEVVLFSKLKEAFVIKDGFSIILLCLHKTL